MSATGGRRRLEAILAADAVGYSRLMAADEDATLAALDAARAVFKARIEANQGRVIDMAGDSVLAVFETASGAVAAALEIQDELNLLAAAAAEDRRMRFRVGVHLGDVIEKADGTVYGDGVNVAARLQALAQPGGVMVSGIVQEAVRDRTSALFEDQGEHEVKNIARPVRAYRVASGAHGVTAAAATRMVRAARRLRWRIWAPAALLLAVAIGAWIAAGKKPSQVPTARASIAVMPFANQSGDPKRDYFSDGITEDIIHALGRFSGVEVISRNAVQAYKGRAMTSAEISRELGVRYIAQGSVRQAGGKLRVTVELSDAEKGAQLWSERYEGAGAQVFEIQDQIVRNIVGRLAAKLTRLEQERAFAKPTESLEAYDLVLRARTLLHRSERTANREARNLLAQALKLAPNYAAAYLTLADAEAQRALLGWAEDVEGSIRKSEALLQKALVIDDPGANARAHGRLGQIYIILGKYDQALSEANRAIELNSSDADAYASRGEVFLWLGKHDESIASFEISLRFDPQLRADHAFHHAFAHYMAGRNRDAVAVTNRGLIKYPDFFNFYVIRAMALGELGDANGARLAAEEVQRRSPFFQTEEFGTKFARSTDQEKVQRALRKAGL